MPALVAFDLDDTLYSERLYVASGLRAVAAEAAAVSGMSAGELLTIALAAGNGHDAMEAMERKLNGAMCVRRMVDIYRSHRPVLTASPEVHGLLARLQRRGNVLAIVTDGDGCRQRAKIHALGLERFFTPQAIIVSGECGSDKSTPAPFVAAEALAPALPKVYVGDNPAKDFYHPGIRGWLTVMLRDATGTNIHPQHPALVPPSYRPSLTVDSLDDLLKLTILK